MIFNNVLSGDVWLCSGQSNMEWTLHMTKGAQKDAKSANYPFIRHFKANKTKKYKSTMNCDVARQIFFNCNQYYIYSDTVSSQFNVQYGGILK